MRKGRHTLASVGKILIVLGLGMILALLLPWAFWWFVLAVGLICFGFSIFRCW